MAVWFATFAAAQVLGSPFQFDPSFEPTARHSASRPAIIVADAAVSAVAADDPFAGDALLTEQEMRDAAGGTGITNNTAIEQAAINSTRNDGELTDVSADGAVTGGITGNDISSNSGVTTVLNNTGNGVIFQSSVQVNVFLNGAAPQ